MDAHGVSLYLKYGRYSERKLFGLETLVGLELPSGKSMVRVIPLKGR